MGKHDDGRLETFKKGRIGGYQRSGVRPEHNPEADAETIPDAHLQPSYEAGRKQASKEEGVGTTIWHGGVLEKGAFTATKTSP